MKLVIKHTSNYTGNITINNELVEILTQGFDEDGHMNGGTGAYINNKDLYYANIQECRLKEDEFKNEMRKIEDTSFIKLEAPITKEENSKNEDDKAINDTEKVEFSIIDSSTDENKELIEEAQ